MRVNYEILGRKAPKFFDIFVIRIPSHSNFNIRIPSHSDFKDQCDILSGFFSNRGYPQAIIDKARARCERVDRQMALTPKSKVEMNKIPLVLPFYEKISKQISKIAFNNGRVLSQDPDIGFLFKDKFLSAYKNHHNIKQHTVRSKLPSVIEEIPGKGTVSLALIWCFLPFSATIVRALQERSYEKNRGNYLTYDSSLQSHDTHVSTYKWLRFIGHM